MADHESMLKRAKERLLYFAECQLATVEDLKGRSRFPKSQVERHETIAREMVDECCILGCTAHDALYAKCPRLSDEMWKRGR